MRLALTLILTLGDLAPLSAKDRNGSKLERYTSEAGQFRVLLPDDDDHEDTTLATAIGPVRVRTVHGDVSRDLELGVSYSDYPEAFASVPEMKLFDGVRAGLKGADGTVDTESDVVLGDGGPLGREFVVRAGKNVVRCRAFLVGSRLYQVTATGRADAVDGKTAAEFFDSFELTK